MADNQIYNTEQTIDLAAWLIKIWSSRAVILTITVAAMFIGVIVAFAIPKRYTAKVLLSPESVQSTNSLASAASVFGLSGINLGAEEDALGITIYPEIVASTPFMIELLATPVRRLCGGATISLSEYLQRAKKEIDTAAIEPFRLTKTQAELITTLRRDIATSIDKKSGITTIAVTLQDPQVAAMVAAQVTAQLQEYVTTYRTSKAEQELKYWEQLYLKRRQEYYEAQQNYADYIDSNHKVVRQGEINRRERLQNEKLLAQQLYASVATQMQMARAKVEEAKPLFATIEPATIPLRASSVGRIKMIARFTLGGVVVALLWVLFGRDFLIEIKKLLLL